MRLLCWFLFMFLWPLQNANAKEADCWKQNQDNLTVVACTKIIKTKVAWGKPLSQKHLARAYSNRGLGYTKLKQYDKAHIDFTVAIRLKPKSHIFYYNRALNHYKNGLARKKNIEFKKAISDLAQTVKLKPDYTDAYLGLGHCYFQIGENDKAIINYDRTLQLNPKHPHAAGGRKFALEAIEKETKLALNHSKEPLNNEFIDQAKNTKQIKKLIKKNNTPTNSQIIVRTGKRIALVIGNDKYEYLPSNFQLQKAKNDARSTAKTFSSLGFDVMRGFNLRRRDMNIKLTKLANKINPGDEVMFFFAGHGVRIDGQNYLLPTDIPTINHANEELLKTESLRVEAISDLFRKRGARLSLLILDACRNNPFKDNRGRSIGGTRGLAPMDPPEGTLVLFSAGAGQEALDRLGDNDANPNSVFTRTFLPMVKQEGLELSRLSRLVKRKVRDLAKSVGHKQTPAVYNEVIGDVYLAQ